MIEHVYRRAAESRAVQSVIVATDDQRVADAVKAFGGQLRMTRADHRTGTERLAEVWRLLALGVVRLRLRNSGQSSARSESFAYTSRPTGAVMRTPSHQEDA